MIADGLTIMFVGMGVVFFFLTLLVFFMLLMSKIVLRFFPDRVEQEQLPAGGDGEIAVVLAAVYAQKE